MPQFTDFNVDHFRYKTYAYENFKKSKVYATGPMKQAVIAPSMLSLLYPLKEEISGYPREAFFTDLINEVCIILRSSYRGLTYFNAGRERHQRLF